MLAQETPGGTDVQTLLTQFGVFGVVIVVFKFMLARQDQRDDKADSREEATLQSLRDDIAAIRSDLQEERRSHDETRKKLYDALMLSSSDEVIHSDTLERLKQVLLEDSHKGR